MIVVFGSINADLVTAVPRLPGPGETVKGPDHQIFPGGKGANQALAARRAGAVVAMAGAVGDDAFAKAALALLQEAGVDLSRIAVTDHPTGIAMIAVDGKGENLIIVASGANGHVDPQGLDGALSPGDLLLLQNEVPERAVLAAARAARNAGARVVLNAAPAAPVSRELAALLDVLVVNEHEAAVIAEAAGLPAEAEAFAKAFAQTYGAATIVTLGAEGALAAENGRDVVRARPPQVRVVDTTGAGDTFTGAFAAALAGGEPLGRALAFGVAAGSLATTVSGAQPSIPERSAIERVLLESAG